MVAIVRALPRRVWCGSALLAAFLVYAVVRYAPIIVRIFEEKPLFLPLRLAVLYSSPSLQPVYSGLHISVALVTIAAVLAFGVWLFRRRKDVVK